MKEINRIYEQFGFIILLLVLLGLGVDLYMFSWEEIRIHAINSFQYSGYLLTASMKMPVLYFISFELFFALSILVLWIAMRWTLKRMHEAEIEKERKAAALNAYQFIMAMMAQNIGRENNRILEKIQFRKNQGKNVSPTIEEASDRISRILSALSRISFSDAYQVKSHQELERMIQSEIKLLSDQV